MKIFYAVADEGSDEAFPWHAWHVTADNRRGYLAIAETESDLLAYLAKRYPEVTPERRYD